MAATNSPTKAKAINKVINSVLPVTQQTIVATMPAIKARLPKIKPTTVLIIKSCLATLLIVSSSSIVSYL